MNSKRGSRKSRCCPLITKRICPNNSERISKLWSECGQSLVEVALLTPVLLALLVGGIELGRYAYIAILVGNAARAGAAYGAEHLGNSTDTVGIQGAADNDFQSNGQNVNSLTVTSTVSCGCDSGGTVSPDTNAACFPATALQGTCSSGQHWVVSVSVTASGTFNSLFSYPGIPTSISISRTAKIRVAEN
jgi:Flp pilus assembly protein TadG